MNVARRGLQRQTNNQTDPSKPVKIKFGPEAALRDEEATSILERHDNFLRWYLDFLKEQLVPTASYQRRISGLKSAIATLKTAKQEAAATDNVIDHTILATISSDPTWIRLLFDLILDPFDDVRETAVVLLVMFPDDVVRATRSTDTGPTSLYSELEEFSRRAHDIAMRTSRADHGDGAARSHGLLSSWSSTQEAKLTIVSNCLDRLQGKLTKAELGLGQATMESPVHGDFASIRYPSA